MVSVSFGLVDATQALQVIVKQAADEEAEASQDINYGTITLGGVVVTFLEDPDVFVDVPGVDLTAAGKHYATGPLVCKRRPKCPRRNHRHSKDPATKLVPWGCPSQPSSRPVLAHKSSSIQGSQ
jgi:hypothetical protein